MADDDKKQLTVELPDGVELSLGDGNLGLNLGLINPEVHFPSLEEIANQFQERNFLSGLEVTEYRFPTVGPDNIPRTYEFGLILHFREGAAVLSKKGNWMKDGQLEPTIGGGPIQSWSRSYVLSGELKGEEVSLGATVNYSRTTEQRETRNRSVHVKEFVDVPTGPTNKTINRRDKSFLWFVGESGLRGIQVNSLSDGTYKIFLPYKGEGCRLGHELSEEDGKLLEDLKIVNDIENPWEWIKVYKSILDRVRERD